MSGGMAMGFYFLLREMGIELGIMFFIPAAIFSFFLIIANIGDDLDLKDSKKNTLFYSLLSSWVFYAISLYYYSQSPQDTLLKDYVEYTNETSMYFMDYVSIFIILLDFAATIGIMFGYKLSRNIYTGTFFYYVLDSYFFVDDFVTSGPAIAYSDLSLISSSIAIYIMHTDWDKCFLDKS